MATLQDHLKKVAKLVPERLERDLFNFIRSIEVELLDLQKKRISVDSKDILGNPIGFYSAGSEKLSGGIKKKGTPFTGINTGDWFKGFYMKPFGDKFVFSSSDPKNDDILTSEFWLSDKLFGLTDEDLKKVISERLLPFFINNFRKRLGI